LKPSEAILKPSELLVVEIYDEFASLTSMDGGMREGRRTNVRASRQGRERRWADAADGAAKAHKQYE
jgi:hypothetical protein